MFITFEGLDFCGKSTQVKLLEDYFKKQNKNIKIIREPGGTKISEKVRNLLLDKENSEMFIETELLLFSASRAQLVREIILPLLKKNYYVISDRFHDSSIAYQGYGRGIDVRGVTEIQTFAIGSALPDISFFIDIPVEEMIRRRSKVGNDNLDRIEISADGFYNRVREGYKKLCTNGKRFKYIDGTRGIDDIHSQIVNEIKLVDSFN